MNTKFNSQICTSREQSERLLALGLKKETADMCWQTTTLNGEPITYISQDVWLNSSIITNNHFPAWSLGRLLEVMRMKASSQIVPLDYTFDRLIEGIETRIKEGYFNKQYLEE